MFLAVREGEAEAHRRLDVLEQITLLAESVAGATNRTLNRFGLGRFLYPAVLP